MNEGTRLVVRRMIARVHEYCAQCGWWTEGCGH